ncbi:hypothetical protein FRAHR75_50056 [Frankia sp. Hr75.2]|nr:hypothetical protein FRAHR75_50056 [Frankia sp. Hr75.2]
MSSRTLWTSSAPRCICGPRGRRSRSRGSHRSSSSSAAAWPVRSCRSSSTTRSGWPWWGTSRRSRRLAAPCGTWCASPTRECTTGSSPTWTPPAPDSPRPTGTAPDQSPHVPARRASRTPRGTCLPSRLPMVSQAVPTPIRLSRACSTLSPKTTSVVVPGRIEVANGLRSALQNTGLTVSTGLSPGVVTAQLPPAQKAAAYADRPAELSTSEPSLLLDGFRLAFAALGLLCLTGIAAALAPRIQSRFGRPAGRASGRLFGRRRPGPWAPPPRRAGRPPSPSVENAPGAGRLTGEATDPARDKAPLSRRAPPADVTQDNLCPDEPRQTHGSATPPKSSDV